jgi:hypothetical protein
MTRTVKTIKVETIRSQVNEYVRNMVDSQESTYKNIENVDDYRKGMASVLEFILHHTGNYKGYNELQNDNGDKRRYYYR